MAGWDGLVFEIVLYGDAGCTIELGRTRTSIPMSFFAGPTAGGRIVPIHTGVIPKDYPIYAKVACNYGGESVDISILYKEIA
jgi:hypothetical protein